VKPQSTLPQAVVPSSEVEDAAFHEALRLSDGLFAHQIEGVAFLLARRRSILADDMGLGKTRQSIVAMRHAAPEGPYLVICPASVKLNWQREIHQVDPEANCTILQGNDSSEALRNPDGWVILNYDILGKRIAQLGTVSWGGIIFDEAHFLKNHKSQRGAYARRLALEGGGDPVVHALTGTPLTNRPRDLFPLLQLVHHPLGRSFLSFAKRYCAATQNDYGWITDGASNLEELALQLHGIMIRRRKDEVLDLPPKLRSWLDVEVEAGTANAEMREVVESLLLARSGAASQDSSRTRLLAKLTKAREKLAAAKVKATTELLEGIVEQGGKAIVFSCYDRPVKALAKHFEGRCVLLTGATPASKRQALVDRFQNDDSVRVFVANIVAGGVGLNLTAARHVVFNDLDWVPANHWQAEDRAYRIGQTGTVNVHYLVAGGTIDEFVRSVLEVKSALVEAVVDGVALTPGATRDVLAELEHMVARISARFADGEVPLTDEEWVAALLDEVEKETEPTEREASTRPAAPALSREAILALARVLTRPAATVYELASGSDPSKKYILTFEASEVTCTCPGFEYRGTCRHARDLKAALVNGKPVPPGYKQRAGA
jgi:SWI/SNF-related matrix-associated actin-dependent regulator of chromatin subfamily A-like protein 1